MPLLEFNGDKSLSQRFNFLNVSGSDEDDQTSGLEPASTSSKLTSITPVAKVTDVKALDYAFTSDNLLPVGVIKSSIGHTKLFINLCVPIIFHSYYDKFESGLLHSDVSRSTDKAGIECFVVTIVDLKSRLQVSTEQDVHFVLAYLKQQTSLDIALKYTLPKMKKKGSLANIPTRHTAPAEPQFEESMVNGKQRTIVQENPIIELPDAPTSGSKHTVKKLSRAILAMPLPTRYTHYFSVPLQRTSDRAASWSVYFDSQDSTLKVLLPPDETFMTVAVKTDDFRAFTKDNVLNIFYIGI